MKLYESVDKLYRKDKVKFAKLVELKITIIKDVAKVNPKSILVLGFSPVLYSTKEKFHVLCDNKDEIEFIRNTDGLKHVNIENLESIKDKKFDLVLALDGKFTKVDTEQNQKKMVEEAFGFSSDSLVVTVKDFKNMKNIERLVDPAMVIGDEMYICQRIWDNVDKQKFKESIYHLSNGEIKSYINEDRRTLYFKQLAKYMQDVGCKEFNISKTQFYKSFFSRQYEFIITIKK